MSPPGHGQPDKPVPWHLLSTDGARQQLRTAGLGLDAAEAAVRRQHFGRNEIAEGPQRGLVGMFLGQFTDFMILVLIAAAVISGLVGDLTDSLVILAIIVLNAVIGFAQEYRAERAIAALKRMAALQAHVLREGQSAVIPAVELVPGDIVLLEAGSAVPADLRLEEAPQLRCDESALTGESEPVEKHTRVLDEADAPLGDRRNMAYKGTLVTSGRGRGMVVATGMETELGRIAGLLRGAKETRTPLQKRLARFGTNLALVVLAICTILFVTGLLRGEPVLVMLLTAISLAVAAIPEALPAVVSILLALGARRMVARHALVRKLPAVETLGSVTFICSDKTGTLTENRMRAEQVWLNGRLLRPADLGGRSGEASSGQLPQDPEAMLLLALALSNDAQAKADGSTLGDPTEVALFDLARTAGWDKRELELRFPRCAELPFDSDRARMTTLHTTAAGVVAFTKGAPEQLLPACDDCLSAAGVSALDRDEVGLAAESMAAEGLRVLGVAMRRWPEAPADTSIANIESKLTFLGLAGLLDPPRAEAREAVQLCKTAGITPVMITGDHPATARAIARRLGIIQDGGEVLTGRELGSMDVLEFEDHVERVRVYARVAPEQKIRIVRALQDKGEFVAMTGDGVNDAPALRRADIGVAMGITGTDVAKEAGHMILLDDNFATIVSAVREGRRIFDNIRKFIKYTMTSNSGEIWTIFLAPFLGLPIPLLPVHILWINLVTDGLPGLALAAEKEERGIMQRPPRPPGESIFAHGMWQHIMWVGLLMGGMSLLTQAWAIQAGHENWQTMVFTVLTLSQLGHVLAIRSEQDSLFTQGVFSNPALIGTVILTVGLQMATIYVPFLNPVFRTAPLTPGELAFCFAMSSVVFAAVEVEKMFLRRSQACRMAPHE